MGFSIFFFYHSGGCFFCSKHFGGVLNVELFHLYYSRVHWISQIPSFPSVVLLSSLHLAVLNFIFSLSISLPL